ncbi:MAG: HAMP domain-containing histidine kinase [Propionibacteriaceae bacterium]|jgi:two-component system OmpR family sensor kinase|nr:HAMP domain-containing histidine kinase [Propionibacteriaceae bacterium]
MASSAAGLAWLRTRYAWVNGKITQFAQTLKPVALDLGLLPKGTLSRRLILRTAAILAALSIVLGITTSITMQRIMERNIDKSLAASQAAFWGRPPVTLPGGHAMNGPGETGLEVVIRAGVVYVSQVYSHSATVGLSIEQIAQLRVVPPNGEPDNVSVSGFREWRVSRQIHDDVEYIVAMPTRGLYEFTNEVVFIEVVVTLISIAIAAVVVNVVVRNSMRPLSQMAETAGRVAALNLGRGEARIAERVPIDPDGATSEVGQVALALNTMLDNVDNALVARQLSETKLRQFVADASHELRNPLASIRGYAELTRRERADLPADTSFALTRIESESKRMSKLVDDMLLLARLDAGREPTLTEVDLTELLVNAVSDAQVADHNHSWSLDVPDMPVLVHADSGQLHQVLVNLLSNARKHTPAGTKVAAAVRVSADNQWIVLTITDDGPGISADALPKIFERFTRADTARTHNAEASTGLGLSIVAAVVSAHGGQVWAESVPGRTVFTVMLPGAVNL